MYYLFFQLPASSFIVTENFCRGREGSTAICGLCRLVVEQFALGKGIKIRVWVQRRVFFFQEPDHYWLKILV